MNKLLCLMLVLVAGNVTAQEVKTVLVEELETKEEVVVEETKNVDAKTKKKEFFKEEDKVKIEETAKGIGSGTKSILRKLGRKSMEETCHLTNTKEVCAQQKLEHEKQKENEEKNGIEPF